MFLFVNVCVCVCVWNKMGLERKAHHTDTEKREEGLKGTGRKRAREREEGRDRARDEIER